MTNSLYTAYVGQKFDDSASNIDITVPPISKKEK